MFEIVSRKNASKPVSWGRVLAVGAGLSIAVAVVYAGLFVGYAITRSSLTIIRTLPDDISLTGTLIANAAAIAIASATVAVLLGFMLIPLGIANAALVKWLQDLFNPARKQNRALLIGISAALLVLSVLQFALSTLIGQPVYHFGKETYLFWLGLPALFHMATSIGAAWSLNQHAN